MAYGEAKHAVCEQCNMEYAKRAPVEYKGSKKKILQLQEGGSFLM